MSSKPQADTFTIEELTERARTWLEAHGLDSHYYRRVQDAPSERTVRYYRTQGLLDEPIKEGKQRRYTNRHMMQLLAVKTLQTRGLTHERIQRELYGRTDAELESVIEAAAPRRAEGPPPSVVVREFHLAPGLRLVATDGEHGPLDEAERAALTARFESALDVIVGPAPRDMKGGGNGNVR